MLGFCLAQYRFKKDNLAELELSASLHTSLGLTYKIETVIVPSRPA